MKPVKHLAIVAGLLLAASANCAWASHGGGFGGHSSFSGHSSSSGGHVGARAAWGGGYHGGGWGGGGWRGGWGPYRGYGGWYGGVWLDPWAVDYWPGYYGGDPEVIVAPVQTPTYVEPAPVTNVPQSGGSDWFYCGNPAGYYPYVRNCSVSWQRVPSTPPAAR